MGGFQSMMCAKAGYAYVLRFEGEQRAHFEGQLRDEVRLPSERTLSRSSLLLSMAYLDYVDPCVDFQHH